MSDANKEIALKVTTDVSQSNQAFKSAEDRLNETKKRMIELATSGQQASKEFRELALEAGKIKGQLELVEQTVDGIGKSANKIEVFSGAIQGMAAGFAIAQGTAALFAEGNEELQQSLVKVQASLALLQGTEQAVQLLRRESAAGQALLTARTAAYNIVVGTSTGALKLFRIALAATGIGAAVVAIGALVANWDKLTGAVMKFVDASPMLTKIVGFITDSFQKLGRAIGIIPSESEAATKQMIADLEKQVKLLEAAGADTFAIEKRLAELRLQLAKETNEGIAEAQDALTILLAKKYGEQDQIRKAAAEKAAAERLAAITKAREQDREALKALNESLTAMEDAREAARKQQAINEENAHLNRMQADAKRRNQIQTEQERFDAIRLADAKFVEEQKYALTLGSFQAIADLSAFFAGQSEEGQERAFKIQKALNIAKTLIETYSAAQSAYASQLTVPDPSAPIRAAVAAGVAIAAGLARVAAIRNTNFNRASTGVVAGIRPAGFGQSGSGTPPPQGFNPNTSTPAPTPPQGGAQGQGGQGQRVYVLESDITNVGRRVQSVERFATFG
jgi:hypothetical protein